MIKGYFSKKVIIFCTVMMVFIFVFPTFSHSQWVYDGPEYKAVHSLVHSSLDPYYMYAGTDDGVFKGYRNNYPYFADWEPAGLNEHKIRALAISDESAQTLYAGTSSGLLFKTLNGGELWTQLSGPPGIIRELVLVPEDDSTLYAVTYSQAGVYKSVNGGNNWTQINNGLSNVSFRCIVMDPQNSSVLYLAAGNNGVFKSSDGGYNWFSISNGLTDNYITSLAIDPDSTNIIYAGTHSDGVYKTTSGGAYWFPSNIGLTISNVNRLGIDPRDTSKIYAGSGSTGTRGLAYSTNGGFTWIDVDNIFMSDSYITVLMVDADVPDFIDKVYVGTGRLGSVFATENYFGHGFLPASYGLNGPNVNCIAFEPYQPFSNHSDYVAYACTGNGLFKSYYNAQDISSKNKWKRLTISGFQDTWLRALVIGHQDRDIIYTTTGEAELHCSMDGGINWKSFETPAFVVQLTIDPQNDSTLYITGNGLGKVYKTTDGGNSWNLIISGINQNISYMHMAIDPLNPSTLYIGSLHIQNGGIFKSTDGGEHWFSIHTGVLEERGVYFITIDPVNTNNIYVIPSLYGIGIYKSSDAGKTWANYSIGLANANLEQILVDPVNPNYLYTRSNGTSQFYKSTDGGQSWLPALEGITHWQDYVGCMTIDPRNDGNIYLGTSHNGIWRYPLPNDTGINGGKVR